MAQDPYAAYGSPAEQAPPPADQQQTPADPQAAPADPYSQVGVNADAPADPASDNPQPLPGFNDEQKKQILAYIPKAKDAADLEQFASGLSGGTSHIGNAQAILEARDKGHKHFSWLPPTPRAAPGIAQQFIDNTKNDVAGIAQGAAAIPDMAAKAAGKVVSVVPTAIGYGLDALGFDHAGKAAHDIAHDLANPLQIGDVVETVAPTPDTTEGHVDRFIGQMVGGAVGMPAKALENAAVHLVGEVPKGFKVTPPPRAATPAEEAAQAASDLGIDLPAFTVKGPAAQAKAARLSKGGFGASDLGQSADTAISQGRAARDTIASDLAPARDLDPSFGEDIKTAATDARTADRSRIGRMYDSGDAMMADVPVTLNETRTAVNGLIDQEEAALVPSPALPFLKTIQAKIGNGGPMTAAALRASAQNLRSHMTANNVDATTADHVIGIVKDAMNGDIETAAKGAGNQASQIYSDAREQWAASKLLDKTVLKPLLGAAFQNTGDQVVRALVSAVKTNGTRVAKLFSTLPEDVANTARASLIMRMGSPTDAAQNAAGDAFSLSDLFKHWGQLKGSRNLVFPKETVQALDKLAKVAEYGKAIERVSANAAVSTTGGFRQMLHSAPSALGAAATYFTHDPKDIALGLLASGISGLTQFRAAKLLANPKFATKLAATPLNPRAATAYWSRPWVKALAVKNPAIAAEIQAFQYHILNDNGIVSSAAASPNANEQSEQQ